MTLPEPTNPLCCLSCSCGGTGKHIVSARTLYEQMMERRQEEDDAAFEEALLPSEPETLPERIERIVDEEWER